VDARCLVLKRVEHAASQETTVNVGKGPRNKAKW
jgi:hypothetical protein